MRRSQPPLVSKEGRAIPAISQGRNRSRRFGKVEIPLEAFAAALKMDDD